MRTSWEQLPFLDSNAENESESARVIGCSAEIGLLTAGTKLDQPNRLKMLSQEALAALAAIPPTKETKALTEKIQARLRKARLT